MYTYIIIDDESLIRKGTIKKLSNLNSKVTCVGQAEDGKAGINLLKEINPDIIITDMNMPTLNGIDFLQFIIENYPQKPVIVISGYKDFEYAKKCIDANVINYILKPFSKDEIISSMETAISILDKDTSEVSNVTKYEQENECIKFKYDVEMLKSLILGYKLDSSNLTSERLRLVSKNNGFILFTIYSSSQLDSNSLNEFSNENGYGDLGLYISHLYCNNIGFFIFFFPKNTPLQLDSTFKKIAEGLVNLLSQNNLHINIGISSAKTKLNELNSAFKESVSALNSKKLSESNTYYVYNEALSFHTISWNKEDELLFRIECREVNEVTNLLSDLFNSFSNMDNYTLYDIKFYCEELVNKTKLILNRYYINISQPNTSTTITSLLNTIFNVVKLEKEIIQLFSNITLAIPNDNIYKDKDIVDKIKIYISNNYSKDISLEFIASLFYINSSYCSRLFKNHTGIKFIDYVNKIRIEHAENLLINTDKKMYSISKSVGYDNVKYFFRIFKKISGLTPEQYRISYSNIKKKSI